MKHSVITINRELASGGHDIGKRTAELLNIPFYDTEIIKDVVKTTGFSEELISEAEQKITSSLLFNVVMNMSINNNYIEKIYSAEKEIILKKAAEGPCVIIGRCANFILEESNVDLLRIFIYADKNYRTQAIMKNYGLTEKEARTKIKNSDNEREIYSKNMFDMTWGKRSNYDLMLNSGILTNEKCSKIITDTYNNKF